MLPDQVQIGEDVLYQQLEKEAVLLNMANQQYYGLNEMGARMWQFLVEEPRVEVVATQLELSYDVDPSILRADLGRLISELAGAGLLKLV